MKVVYENDFMEDFQNSNNIIGGVAEDDLSEHDAGAGIENDNDLTAN